MGVNLMGRVDMATGARVIGGELRMTFLHENPERATKGPVKRSRVTSACAARSGGQQRSAAVAESRTGRSNHQTAKIGPCPTEQLPRFMPLHHPTRCHGRIRRGTSRLCLLEARPPSTRPSHPLRGTDAPFNLMPSVTNCLPGQPRRSRYDAVTATAQIERFSCSPKTTRTFIENRCNDGIFQDNRRLQFLISPHAHR